MWYPLNVAPLTSPAGAGECSNVARKALHRRATEMEGSWELENTESTCALAARERGDNMVDIRQGCPSIPVNCSLERGGGGGKREDVDEWK